MATGQIPNINRLHEVWELFRSSVMGTYDRNSKLDLFLAECLKLHRDGVDIKQWISEFTALSSVTSLIGCELLCDVHQMIQRIKMTNSEVDTPLEEPTYSSTIFGRETSALAKELFENFTDRQLLHHRNTLKKNILKGVAWKILAVIQILGANTISCKRQLCGLLIWLCEGLSGEGNDCSQKNQYLRLLNEKCPIYDLFKNKIWIKEKIVTRKRDNEHRKRYIKRPQDKATPLAVNVIQSSDSERDSELQSLGQKKTVQNVLNSSSNNPVALRTPLWEQSEQQPPIENYLNEEIKEILNSEINLYEFHLIALDVLHNLSKSDYAFADIDVELSISYQVVNFAIKQLYAIECKSLPILLCDLDSESILHLKCVLTELLLVSIDQNTLRLSVNLYGLHSNCLPLLIATLRSSMVILKNRTDFNERERLYASKYIFGINYAILILLYFSLFRRGEQNILDLVQNDISVDITYTGLVFGRSIALMMEIDGDNDFSVELVKKLLILIMRFITLLKRVRAVRVHSSNCKLEEHKECRAGIQKVMHHHNAEFGKHALELNQEDAIRTFRICSISTFFSIFPYLMSDQYFIKNDKLRLKILKCMKSCGTCCCFSPEYLLENSAKLINSYNDVAKICFDVLEHILYNQIGFIKLDSKNTTQCKMCEITYKSVSLLTQVDSPEGSQTIYSWPFFKVYNKLLQSDNSALIHSTMNHILQVSLICNINMKRDLLFNVLYPSFEIAKCNFLTKKSANSCFITLSCLRLFTNLICSVPSANEFIKSGKLNSILELMRLPEFSKSCCALLEIAIDVEIFQIQMKFFTNLQEDRPDLITIDNMVGTLPSLGHLIACLKIVSDKLLEYCKSEIKNDRLFSELINMSSQENAEFLVDDKFVHCAEPVNEDFLGSLKDRLEILKSACIYWKTCSTLCLYCPILRQHLAHQTIFLDSYKLLRVLLYCIYYRKFSRDEGRLIIKMIESLVIIGLCLSESTMNQSKNLTVRYLSEALLSDLREIDELNIKLLLEMLIRVSSVYINNVQILPDIVKKKLPTFEISFPDTEANASSEDEDESKYVCPYFKDDSDQYITADEGYEADIEICPVDGTVGYKTRNFAAANKNLSNITKLMKNDGILHDSQEILLLNDVKKNFLVHGEISNVLIDVIMKFINIIVEKFERNKFDNTTTVLHNLVCKCINRLTSIFSIEDNCTIVNELILRILSNPASRFLKSNSNKLEELQRSLLGLICAIATHCIMPMELKSYLKMFTHSNIPIKILLEPLVKLSKDVVDNVPDFILCFPIKKINEHDSLDPRDFAADIHPGMFEMAHMVNKIVSSWSTMSLWCPLEKIECIWFRGYSAAMWIRLQNFHPPSSATSDLFQFSSCDESDNDNIPEWKYKRNRYFKSRIHQNHKYFSPPKNAESDIHPNLLHLFSVGQTNFITEFWVNANSGSLHIINCSPDYTGNLKVGSQKIAGLFPLRKWFHFAVNVQEKILKDSFGLEVTIFINSVLIDKVTISLYGNFHKMREPTYLLLGHSTSKYNENIQFAGSWCVSEMYLFRSPVLNQNNIIYLIAHGPNKLSLQKCQVDKTTLDFSSLFGNSKIISSNINWDKVLETPIEDIKKLENELLLKFSASNPLQAEFHHQSKASLRGLYARTPNELNMSAGTLPGSVMCTWVGTPMASQYRGLPVAVHLLGGPQMLLYLFARIVELNGNAEEQAAALEILLKISYSDMRLYSAFHHDEIISLLLAIFSSEKCLMSFNLLKVMLSISCNESVLVNINSRFHVLTKSQAIILRPEIIIALVKAWKDLERNFHVVRKVYNVNAQTKTINIESESTQVESDSSSQKNDIIVDGNKTLWETMLISLKSLTREDHPNRVFNVYQLNRVNLIDSLLTSCKERFINSDFEILNEEAIKDMIDLIRCLIGVPPDFKSVSNVIDFLILMHQANLTFVTHSRSSFYFLLSPDIHEPEKKSTPLLSFPFMGRKKSKRSSKRRRHGHMIKQPPQTTNRRIPPREEASAVNTNLPVVDSPLVQNVTPISEPVSAVIPSSSAQEVTSVQASEIVVEESSHDIATSEIYLAGIFPNFNQNTSLEYASIDPSENQFTNDLLSITAYEIGDGKGYLVIFKTVEGDKIKMSKNLEEQLPYMFNSPLLQPGRKSIWVVCENLLLLLRDIILVLSDHDLHQVLGKVFNPNILLVLCNHEELYIRTSVVKVITSLLHRYFPDEVKLLVDSNYFIHLSNQLSLYQASFDLIVACSSLIFAKEVRLECIIDSLDRVEDDALLRCPPLLGLLSCTFHNIVVFRHTLNIIRKIVEKGSIKVLSQVGMCESIIKCLKFLGSTPQTSFSDFEEILKGLQNVLADITVKILHNDFNHRMLIDLYHQLHYFELTEKQPLSNRAREICLIMRETSSYVFNIAIDFISEKMKSYDAQNKFLRRPRIEVSRGFGNPLMMDYSFAEVSGRSESSQVRAFRISKGELLTRHYETLLKAYKFIVSRDITIRLSFTENQLIEKLFLTILNDICVANARHIISKWWNSNDSLQNIFVNLFNWIITPTTLLPEIQIAIVTRVSEEKYIQEMLTPSDPVKQKKLSLHLKLIVQKIDRLITDRREEENIRNWIRDLGSEGDVVVTHALNIEILRIKNREREDMKKAIDMSLIEKSVFSKNFLAVSLIESAMSITRNVGEIQNSERKTYFEHVRRNHNSLIIVTQKWRDIIDKYCHEMGVWYSQESYPNSWELNPTEGPDRIRIRLRRSNIKIDDRFFKPEYRERNKLYGISKPLAYLFDSLHIAVQGELKDRLHFSESISFMSQVTYITVKHEQAGELLLSDRCIHFLPAAGDDHHSITGEHWPLIDIVHVFTRRWRLKERAVEVFLSSGHAHLIAFASFKEMRSFVHSLEDCHLPNRVPSDSLLDVINQWRNGNLSNWTYLMQLNSKAGRTYNDLMQYPVFPFILADYRSQILDLNKPNSFRNLHKPMAIQRKENEGHYIINYNYLRDARDEQTPRMNREPYHYGSHYSNSGTVLHFLVRLSPFTKLFLNYQDNNFDIPDRTFHSVATTWRLSSCESNTDVKELIPEFFYLTQFLCNSEGLNFGIRQCGVPVDDVELPPWAKNPRLFILIHRQALESAYVKENLPNWIDLVFGYKQTGQAAIDAVNVFHPATYYGFDPSDITDELERNAWETMVRTYGQTPRQLLKQPHPQHITDLKHDSADTIEVLPSVKGLRWGSYCFSPEEPEPILVERKHNRRLPIQELLSLRTNEVFGMVGGTAIMPLFERIDGTWKSSILNLILWGYPDGIVRIKYKDEPPKPLIKIPDLDSLCAVSQGFGATSSTLWLGLKSGRIIVLIANAFNTLIPTMQFSKDPINLYGHNAQIVDISVCVPFGVTVSASVDGVINIWDLHNFTFIRTIDSRISTVSKVCISQTLGDIATVHFISPNSEKSDNRRKDNSEQQEELMPQASTSDGRNSTIEVRRRSSKSSAAKYRSKICVRTINGSFVGQVKIFEKVCCVCYSNAPEGTSVNVIAVGLETGSIRLFSSWDLKPLNVILPASPTHPIISMTYSENSEHFYACASDGTILFWRTVKSDPQSMFRVYSPKTFNLLPSH